MTKLSLYHPSATQRRTALALEEASKRAGLRASGNYEHGKWDLSLATPDDEGRVLFQMTGMTRTTIVAIIAVLNAIGERDARDSDPRTPLHGQARGSES